MPIGSKRKKTTSTRSTLGSDDEPFLVRGVVLAPYDTRYNAEAATPGDVDVKVIAGADAFALLGALQQAVGKPLRPPGRCA